MPPQALLIVDMQQGLFPSPRPDVDRLLSRINNLAARLRARQSAVIFIQHCGSEGDDLHPSQPGHALHSGLAIMPEDVLIAKNSCDAFLGTNLASALGSLNVNELIVTGFATDFCVDTTVRSALAQGYKTIVPGDGHTTAERPHLSVQDVIDHHNFIWANFVSPAGAAHLTRCEAIT